VVHGQFAGVIIAWLLYFFTCFLSLVIELSLIECYSVVATQNE
jgi:hypothetical protein